MADLREEHGNPIQLTDERGNHVQLTNEFGNPVGLSGVVGDQGHPHEQQERREGEVGEHRRSSSSSSSSSEEDDGQGGRRKKKKGTKDKLEEKITGGKHGDGHSEDATAATETVATTIITATEGEQRQQEKTSMMEKIKEKLPCFVEYSSVPFR